MKKSLENWEEKILRPALKKAPERQESFTTVSGQPVRRLYTPADLIREDSGKSSGRPGEDPFTRGIHETMYLGHLWTMRQVAGFGTAQDSNRRYRFLLDRGQMGLSIAFDLPTILGRDSDDPSSKGEVGRIGVAVDTLDDMETLFRGISLDRVTTSMAIDAPATVLLSMYLVAAEKQGVSWKKVGGTTQSDVLKEYITRKSYLFPPGPSLRLITDMTAFCAEHVPRWNTISVSGFHIREAGATAVQELAFALADGIGYVQAGTNAGLDVDVFAPRLSFFFDAHADLFEEVAKYRAARRMWAKIMKERFKARNPKSLRLRFHASTAGCSLTAQQPYNNVIRTTIEALASVLGGTQSLHVDPLNGATAPATEESATLALRTQQILAEESGVAASVDPLGGSYFVESLTDEMEKQAFEYIAKIDGMGGIVAAIAEGYPQKEIENASSEYRREVEAREKIIVGVNKYVTGEKTPGPAPAADGKAEEEQIQNVTRIKSSRDVSLVKKRLEKLRTAAKGGENVMPYLLECVRAYASLGEMCGVFRSVFDRSTGPDGFKWTC